MMTKQSVGFVRAMAEERGNVGSRKTGEFEFEGRGCFEEGEEEVEEENFRCRV
jgi:hypothetical protein